MWTHNAPFRAIRRMLEKLATATTGSTLLECGYVEHIGYDLHQMMLEKLRHTSNGLAELWQHTITPPPLHYK